MTRASVVAFLAGVKLAAGAAALAALARDAHLVEERDRAVRQAEYWRAQVVDTRCGAALHEAELLAAQCAALHGHAVLVDAGRGDVSKGFVVRVAGEPGGER